MSQAPHIPRKQLFIDTQINAVISTNNTAPSFATGNGIFTSTTSLRPITSPSDQEVVTADGKRLVVSTNENASGNIDFALLRYNKDGSLDASFGNLGKVTTDIAQGNDTSISLTVQADGKILVVGWFDGIAEDIALVRYNPNGSLDTSFSGDGKVTTDLSTNVFETHDRGMSITTQKDGKILVAGSSLYHNFDFALVRYNPNGSLDTSFSGDGKLTTDFNNSYDVANHVKVLADSKILVLGSSYSSVGKGFDFALVRYNSDGSLDTSFSTDGRLTTDISGWNDLASNVAVQADGKYLVVGNSQPAGSSYTDIAIVRYNSDGSLDTSFGKNGKVITNLSPDGDDSADSVTIQADGKILVIGTSHYHTTTNVFTMVRYNSNGTIDKSFDLVKTLDGYPHYINNGGIPFVFLDDHSNPTYTENYSPVAMDADVNISDAELDAVNNYNGASITLVRHGGANSEDQFSLGGYNSPYFNINKVMYNNIAVAGYTQSGGHLTITFNEHATSATVDRVLQTLSYRNISDTPPASVQIDWKFNDGNIGAQGTGGALTALGSVTVNIQSINDAPVLVTPLAIHYFDTAFDDSFSTAKGQLSASDVDSSHLTYGIVGGTDSGNGTISKGSDYGVLTVTKATGMYHFFANDTAIEALKTNVNANFTMSVSDGALIKSKILKLNIFQSGVTESNSNDTLVGTSVNDKFNSLSGADTLKGGLGNDTYVVDNVGDVVAETSTLATEIDLVNSLISYKLTVNVENLTLIGTATTNGIGNNASNRLIGNSANNILSGHEGNDLLNGGLGNDQLIGGSGQDKFVFNTALTAKNDKITDFVVFDDTVVLENAIFTKLSATGVLSSGNFKIGAPMDSNDFIVYNQTTGTLFYDADGSGVGAMAQITMLGINLALTSADFVVI